MTTLADLKLDADGYLADPNDWTPEVAELFAQELGIELTDRHWQVINYVRQEWEKTGEMPTLRRITKQSGVPTKELYKLFPKGPAGKIAKISGLGKPKGCI